MEHRLAAQSLILFDSALQDPVGEALCAWLDQASPLAFASLARALWKRETSLQSYLIDQVLHADNPFTRASEAGRPSPELLSVAEHDLTLLGALFHMDPPHAPGLPALPPFTPASEGIRAQLATAPDWGALAEVLAEHYRRNGAGDQARYHAFRWSEGGLQGITDPDPIRLEQLVGDQTARNTVIRNTEQFLSRLPANNLLLYGDRGTGKSSTVKALLHRFGPDGLRLVEVSRRDLSDLPRIMQHLRGMAQRFILYLDDLSFEPNDDSFKSFKAALEGSLERQPANVLVYATSNRKHLIRERHADRSREDEVHLRDSLQETASLADRFGMTVIFSSPDQEEYLTIVGALAEAQGITLPPEELRQLALQWALWQNGRSGRSARQFVDDLAGRLALALRS